MGLSIKITTSSGVVQLADDNEDISRSNFTVNGERQLEVRRLFRATHVSLFDRGNRATVLAFDTKRIHEDPFEAIVWAMDHMEEVPIIGLVELTISWDGQVAKRWLQDAGVDLVGLPRQLGASTWQRYQITGGQILKANPNT